MKREKKLTKKERKAIDPRTQVETGGGHHHHQHIHCTSCGKHLDAVQFTGQATATWVTCDHGSRFASCTGCLEQTRVLLAEHDRTGEPVRQASAWH